MTEKAKDRIGWLIVALSIGIVLWFNPGYVRGWLNLLISDATAEILTVVFLVGACVMVWRTQGKKRN
jgi:hypothetical protein